MNNAVEEFPGQIRQLENYITILEKEVERIFRWHHSADMWSNAGQDMIATNHQSMFGVEQTQMVGGVSRGMNRNPIATGKAKVFGIS